MQQRPGRVPSHKPGPTCLPSFTGNRGSGSCAPEQTPLKSRHAIDHTPQSRTGKSMVIRVRAIVVGLPLRNKAANRPLYMDHYLCPWVGITAEQPVITVHRRRCPPVQPLGILFSHIDATAAHPPAEVAVPLSA